MLNHRNIKSLFFIVAILITGLFLYVRKGEESLVLKRTDQRHLEVLSIVHKIWSGENAKEYLQDDSFKCPSIQVGRWRQIPREYYACHPEFFKCALEYEFDTNKKYSSLNLKPRGEIQKGRSQSEGWFLKQSFIRQEKSDLNSIEIKLRPVCRQVVLPKEKYLSQQRKVFEVFNEIKIDRYLFNYSDLAILKKLYPRELENLKVPKEVSWYEPVKGIKANEMKKICELSGKEILRSEYLDAASFLPKKIEGLHQNEFKAPYIYNHSTSYEKAITENHCQKIPTGECPEFTMIRSPHFSWIGVSQLHGGIMEYVPPKFFQAEKGNVWTSSKFFPKESFYHRIGVRAFWNGEEQLRKNIDFSVSDIDEKLNLPEKVEIGFRCISIN